MLQKNLKIDIVVNKSTEQSVQAKNEIFIVRLNGGKSFIFV